MAPAIRSPHCGQGFDEHPCFETPDGARAYECVRCAREFTVRRAAGDTAPPASAA